MTMVAFSITVLGGEISLACVITRSAEALRPVTGHPKASANTKMTAVTHDEPTRFVAPSLCDSSIMVWNPPPRIIQLNIGLGDCWVLLRNGVDYRRPDVTPLTSPNVANRGKG